MGVSRARAVKRHKKKELEKTLKWIVYPPAIATALLLGVGKKKKQKNKKSPERPERLPKGGRSIFI